ncbi:hypothetical protein [Schlesneria sp.]|uniref:hypothetical protein n=1 Tax=Schlesneria sp. TaxID=2762018 RepID=UPI002EE459BA
MLTIGIDQPLKQTLFCEDLTAQTEDPVILSARMEQDEQPVVNLQGLQAKH